MSQPKPEPNPELVCWDCGAPNNAGDAQCWMCDRPDWRDFRGVRPKRAARAIPRAVEATMIVAVIACLGMLTLPLYPHLLRTVWPVILLFLIGLLSAIFLTWQSASRRKRLGRPMSVTAWLARIVVLMILIPICLCVALILLLLIACASTSGSHSVEDWLWKALQ